ncbi:hypothetical protein GGX14DRAFT_558636 [Mycena pura]|uniref:Uncharacterized protein n=1 Tax=Mycena pura TaxID=153505 RepID=A0AAD6YLG1_9AGAR|nr:hypothetical protein GGX14DRAFT_558636 [Mycena pura]
MALDSVAKVSSIFGIANLIFSIFNAAAKIEPNSEHNAQVAYAFLATGCINMASAYLRRNIHEGYFDSAFAVSLAVAAMFNWITVLRVGLIQRRNRDKERRRDDPIVGKD